jgi:hypothetical protein
MKNKDAFQFFSQAQSQDFNQDEMILEFFVRLL